MLLRVPMLSGRVILSIAFDPVSRHAREFLFAYPGAVVAGFLLMAVPDWTGRPPIVDWPLGALFAFWIAAFAGFSTLSGRYLPRARTDR